MDFQTSINMWGEWEKSINNILDVISRKRHWNTGAIIRAGPESKYFPMPKETPSPTPTPTPGGTGLEEYYGWWSAYGDTMEDFYTTTSEVIQEKSKQSFNVFENLSQCTAEAMEQNFLNLYFDIMSNKFDSLRDYANAALDSIRRATSDVLGQMTKELLFGGGASGGSGWISSALGWAGFGGNRQYGGPVDPGKTYIVGEKGPEFLYMGNRGGQIVPGGTDSTSRNINSQPTYRSRGYE
ncbi:MAG: hypothetical protein SRB2_02142 [Desulfobacteraceae bacterium Eth-SRB2]|nr:MAG: hypothetical protein SRB2_02142 [Desulfobacteraceae bacterium Eth-SRB2]